MRRTLNITIDVEDDTNPRSACRLHAALDPQVEESQEYSAAAILRTFILMAIGEFARVDAVEMYGNDGKLKDFYRPQGSKEVH